MRRKNLKNVLAAGLSFSMVVSSFSAGAFNPVKAQAASDSETYLTKVLDNETDITLREKWDDTSNVGDERKVTIEGTGTEMTIKDNGKMRKELSSQYLAQNEMGAGINLGNTMEGVAVLAATEASGGKDKYNSSPTDCETVWTDASTKAITSQEYIDKIHSYGINTLRIPVAWSNADKDDGTYTINADYLGRVEEIVNYALNDGMYVIINDHWDNQWWGQFGACQVKEVTEEDGTKTREAVLDEDGNKIPDEKVRAEAWKRYESYWTQIANRFKGYSDHLIFEGANEELGNRLNDAITSSGYSVSTDPNEKGINGCLTEDECYETTNAINQKFVDIVRGTGGNNAYRHLLIPGYSTDIDATVDAKHVNKETDKEVEGRFVMPKDTDENGNNKLFLSVHYYTPTSFCLDGGTGTYSVADQKATQANFAKLKKFTDQGYAVIVGECGVCNPAGVEGSVTQWLHDTFTAAQENYAVPVLWDTPGTYWNRQTKTMNYKDIAVFYNIINGTSGDTSMDTISGGKPSETTGYNYGKYIDKELWETKGIHAYLFFQTSDWDYRNEFVPAYKLGKSNHTFEYIKAGGQDAADNIKVVDVQLTKNGTYTVSIDGLKSLYGTQYKMLGVATDISKSTYKKEPIQMTDAHVFIDGEEVTDPDSPITLTPKTDRSYLMYMAANTYRQAKEASTSLDLLNDKNKLPLAKKSMTITFTVSGLDKVLEDIENKTWINPQTGLSLWDEEHPATPTPSAEAPTVSTAPGASVTTPSGIATPPVITKVGPKVNKTFTVGKYKYKVTKQATTVSQGAVKVVGVTKKGKKAKKLSVAASVKYKKAGFKVNAIGAKSFKGVKATSITLNKNIKTIPSASFANCKKLKTLTIKAKLKKVSKGAFKGCKKKIKVKGASAKVRKANVKLLKKSGYKKFK